MSALGRFMVGMFFVLSLSAAVASAEPICKPQPTRLKDFTCALRISLMVERVAAEATVTSGDPKYLLDNHKQYLATIEPMYKDIKLALRNDPQTLARINDAYATWLAASEGFLPMTGETKRTYVLRVNTMADRLNEQLHRLELELP